MSSRNNSKVRLFHNSSTAIVDKTCINELENITLQYCKKTSFSTRKYESIVFFGLSADSLRFLFPHICPYILLMKKHIPVLALLLASQLHPQTKMNLNNLIEFGGKKYELNVEKPFTGEVFNLYESTGKKKVNGQYKNGIKDGKWTWYRWDEKKREEGTYQYGQRNGKWTKWYNGQKEEGNYMNGKPDGIFTGWYENGQKWQEATFKNGRKDGLWTRWYENGQMEKEITYKDGKEDGLWTKWYENRQKLEETTYKDGKKDGLWTYWHDNGQKSGKVTYKDGKRDGKWTWYNLYGN